MRDPFPVVDLLCKRIPRQVLNAHYGIQIPMPSADAMLASKDGTIPPPTVDEFLTTYCVARSMLAASSGVPDFQRASRIVIKEYAAGKLLYCHAPPDFDDALYQRETLSTAIRNTAKLGEKLKREERFLEETNSDDGLSENDQDSGGSVGEDIGIEDDEMLMELMGDMSAGNTSKDTSGSGKTNAKGRQKRWGKKGRKLRNKDPYGCHSTPDETLAGSDGPLGVTVKAGKKHTRKNYVRANGYGAATANVLLS